MISCRPSCAPRFFIGHTQSHIPTHDSARSIVDENSPAALESTLMPIVLLTARMKADAAIGPYVSSG